MFAEDLAEFFDPDGHALAATYDGDTSVYVIFDRAFIEAITGIAGTNPVALVQTSALDADPNGKALAIPGKGNFVIRGFKPQDDGAILLLELEVQ